MAKFTILPPLQENGTWWYGSRRFAQGAITFVGRPSVPKRNLWFSRLRFQVLVAGTTETDHSFGNGNAPVSPSNGWPEEEGTELALTLWRRARLAAPDLLVPECASILWKKVQRKELGKDEALIAARLLQSAEIELVPARPFMEAATRLAIDLDHPAYDCLYLALAIENECRFVTADERLVNKIRHSKRSLFRDRIVGSAESVTEKT